MDTKGNLTKKYFVNGISRQYIQIDDPIIPAGKRIIGHLSNKYEVSNAWSRTEMQYNGDKSGNSENTVHCTYYGNRIGAGNKIEDIFVEDFQSSTGVEQIGFRTYYENLNICSSTLIFDRPEICFEYITGQIKRICVEPNVVLGSYAGQYGITISEKWNCFFVSSWLEGVFCCDIDTGRIKWNYRNKHAGEVFVYPDYVICAFQGEGIKKLSYCDGTVISNYAMTTYAICAKLEGEYIFIGPRRKRYEILDTESMKPIKTIKPSNITQFDDETLIILSVEGNLDSMTIMGYEGNQPYTFVRLINI